MSITIDHGTESTLKVLAEWAERRGVTCGFIHPEKANENGRIESFSGRPRDECLSLSQFESIKDAIEKIDARRSDYNDHWSYSSLGHLTPNKNAQNRQGGRAPELAVL